jgi:hypothetical protein
VTQFFQGQIKGTNRIEGATDGTLIGNVGDSLKVVYGSGSPTTSTMSWGKKLRYDDMNASTGGIARGSTITVAAGYTNIYSYSGSGYLAGLIVNIETFSGWTFRLQIDGDTIFELVDTDLTTDTIYDVDDVTDSNQSNLGISKSSHDRFVWHAPMNLPIYYSSSIVVSIKRTGSSKKFQAGLVVLSRET